MAERPAAGGIISPVRAPTAPDQEEHGTEGKKGTRIEAKTKRETFEDNNTLTFLNFELILSEYNLVMFTFLFYTVSG
jgi:hypothetical protein